MRTDGVKCGLCRPLQPHEDNDLAKPQRPENGDIEGTLFKNLPKRGYQYNKHEVAIRKNLSGPLRGIFWIGRDKDGHPCIGFQVPKSIRELLMITVIVPGVINLAVSLSNDGCCGGWATGFCGGWGTVQAGTRSPQLRRDTLPITSTLSRQITLPSRFRYFRSKSGDFNRSLCF